MIEALKIRTPDQGSPVGRLSGGNQQKVLLARWLLANSRIVLLYDVTRGVDVATKHEIYELMMRLAGEGRARARSIRATPKSWRICATASW